MTSVPRSWRIGIGLAALLLVAVAGSAIWYQFFRDDSPPPVSIADAVGSLGSLTSTPVPTKAATNPTTTATTTTANGATTAPSPSPAATTASSQSTTASASGIAGQWTIDGSAESFVGYRVGEQLAGVGTTTAVGRTSQVQGTLAIDGTQVSSVNVEANLASLKSDESRRDRALSQQALQTSTYPTARFELTTPIDLQQVPADGTTFKVTAHGNLTLHGVTRAIELPLQGQFTNGRLVVIGSTEIQFADYQIDQPSAQIVLAVNDHGTMELQLVFTRA